jgi:hypothetical protein
MRNLAYPILRAAFREIYADLARIEDVLRDSDLGWTVVRPVRLTDKPVTGTYRTAFGQNVRHGLFISRATSPTTCSARSTSPRRSGGRSASPTNLDSREAGVSPP